MGCLVLSPDHVLTCWERGLIDLADHYYQTGGYSLHGETIRAFEAAARRGCRNRREFRTVVADILGCDKNSSDMHQMANCAFFGRLYDVLSGAITYEALLNRRAASLASSVEEP